MRLFLEVLLWINGAVLTLVLVLILALQLPAVQQFAAKKATWFLGNKLKTRVSVGRFTTDWRNSLVLKDIYIEDQNKDTLLFAGRLGLDLNMLALTRQEFKLRNTLVRNAVLNLKTTSPDSINNWQFIADAFQSNTPDSTAKRSSAKSVLEIRNVKFLNTRLTIENEVKGNFIRARLGELSVDMKPGNKTDKIIELGKIKLRNSKISWLKSKETPPENASQGKRFTFERIDLGNLEIEVENKPANEKMAVKLGSAEIKADKFSLEEGRADLSKLTLENTAIQLVQYKVSVPDSLQKIAPAPRDKNKSAASETGWAVWLHETKFRNVSLSNEDFNVPELTQGLDLNHLFLKDINLHLANVYYNSGKISGVLETLQLKEKNGFMVKNLTGKVKAGPESLELTEFLLKTNNSTFRSDLTVSFPAAKGKNKQGNRKSFSAFLRPTTLVPTDLLYLAPDLKTKPFFRKLGTNPLVISGKVSGSIKDLNLAGINLKGWSGTRVNFSAKIKDLQLPKSRELSLQIRRFSTNKRDLELFTGGSNSPTKFRFPAAVSLTGNLQSTPNAIAFQNLQLAATNGLVLHTTGKITGPANNRAADLNIKKLTVTRQSLLGMLPAGAVTPEVQLPDNIHFAGTFNGASLQQFSINGNFTTTFGNAYTNIKIRPVQEFSGHISLDNFNLGKLLKQEGTLGPATGKADFQGKGFKVKTMQLHYDANIKKLVYDKETYRNIQLEGNLNEKIYHLHGNLANAALQGLGHKLKKLKPKNIDLKKADPTRLIPKDIDPKKMIPKMFRKKKKQEEKPE